VKRAALYTRVSTPGQGNTGTSLQSQSEDCRTYAQKQGYSVVLERADVYSGTSMSRAGLEEVLDAARRGEMDVVVCLAIDRSNRDLADLLVIDRELTRLGVTLEFVRDPRERTPQGDLFFQIKGAFAQYEHAIITERMRRGKAYTVQQGKVMAGRYAAFGYAHDPETRNLVVVEAEAALVRYMFERVGRDGGTLNRVARELNTMGVPTPQGARVWRETTVQRIIESETYVGRWAYGRKKSVKRPRKGVVPSDGAEVEDVVQTHVMRPRSEWVIVPVPPIVEEDLWQAAQRQIKRNAHHASRNRKREYLLAGMVYCAECARTMYGMQSRGGAYLYYKCSGYQINEHYLAGVEHIKCGMKFVRVETLDALVWAEAERQINNPALLEDALLEAERENPTEVPLNRARLAALDKQRASLEREGERLLDLYLGGDIAKGQYVTRTASLKKRVEAVDSAQREIDEQIAEYQGKVRTLAALSERMDAVREGLPHMTFEDKRAFLLGMGVQVSVRRAESAREGHVIDIDNLLAPVRGLPLPLPRRKRANQWTG
jgi:site-specific DNA recombinase